MILFASRLQAKSVYTGSTPANIIVRTFLNIPATDSVDFIRWKLVMGDVVFALDCDYGVGKPNTNGFIDKKSVHLEGRAAREGQYLTLVNGNRRLVFAVLNTNLIHIAGMDKKLMAGTGGWAYTLSRPGAGKLPLAFSQGTIQLKDSMTYQGRTPCGEFPGMGLTVSENCYKLKWLITLYAHDGKPTTYSTRGTAFRNSEPRSGKWSVRNGMIKLEGIGQQVYLLAVEENILLFVDAAGRLLQGDADFSYTLSRK